MSVQVGAGLLQRPNGGRGVLLGGVPGVEPAQVVILGGGVAGTAAAEMAVGLRAKVTVIDRSLARLRELDREFRGSVTTLYSTSANIERSVTQADLVIGSVLIPGDAAPKLITKEMLASMREKVRRNDRSYGRAPTARRMRSSASPIRRPRPAQRLRM